MIQIRCDIDAFKSIYTNAEKEQIPFAVSVAINNTAKGAQAFVQEGEKTNFIIRRDWVLTESVKISHFSTKREDPIHARIQVGDKADFMNKFEEGDRKVPRSGANIAIPIMARPNKAAIVPETLRPHNLQLRSIGATIRGNQRTFMMTMSGGRQGIFQRTGPGKRDYILLYWLQPSAPTPASLHFEERITDAVARLWAQEFEKAFAEAMETAR